MPQKSVIIVAGGSGIRMNSALPKQFLAVAGKPVLVHTIEAFLTFDAQIAIILVLPQVHVPTWEQVQKEHLPDIKIQRVIGGQTRFQSVKAGLTCVSEGIVAIHDAVRPLVSREVIRESFEKAAQTGSGVVMVPMKESLRQAQADGTTKAADRSAFYMVQTPQTFQVKLIRKAFEQAETPAFTDDASVYEAAGGIITPVTGDYRNIKITTPEDLHIAEVLLK